MFFRRKANSRQSSWSKKDENILVEYLRKEKFNTQKLREMFPNRSAAALKSKTRKLRIKNDLFGESYRDLKMDFTEKHANLIRPRNVFEAYCGAGHQSIVWTKFCLKLFASDKSAAKKSQFQKTIAELGFRENRSSSEWIKFSKGKQNVFFFNGDVVDAAIDIRQTGIQIDVLDLDTCGSTLPLLPMLLAIIRPRYLFITHGEFHSKRFNRDDVLRRVLFHRDITQSCLTLTVDELSAELDKAVKVAALRCHNETKDSVWATLIDEQWLGSRFHGMLRRVYEIKKAPATADCLNELINGKKNRSRKRKG